MYVTLSIFLLILQIGNNFNVTQKNLFLNRIFLSSKQYLVSILLPPSINSDVDALTTIQMHQILRWF